jgi:hypothetical protein
MRWFRILPRETTPEREKSIVLISVHTAYTRNGSDDLYVNAIYVIAVSSMSQLQSGTGIKVCHHKHDKRHR